MFCMIGAVLHELILVTLVPSGLVQRVDFEPNALLAFGSSRILRFVTQKKHPLIHWFVQSLQHGQSL